MLRLGPVLCGLFRKNSRLPKAVSAYWSIATWMASMCLWHQPSLVPSLPTSASALMYSASYPTGFVARSNIPSTARQLRGRSRHRGRRLPSAFPFPMRICRGP